MTYRNVKTYPWSGGSGAIRETAEVIDIEEIPFTYMPGKREKVRIRVKGKVLQ